MRCANPRHGQHCTNFALLSIALWPCCLGLCITIVVPRDLRAGRGLDFRSLWPAHPRIYRWARRLQLPPLRTFPPIFSLILPPFLQPWGEPSSSPLPPGVPLTPQHSLPAPQYFVQDFTLRNFWRGEQAPALPANAPRASRPPRPPLSPPAPKPHAEPPRPAPAVHFCYFVISTLTYGFCINMMQPDIPYLDAWFSATAAMTGGSLMPYDIDRLTRSSEAVLWFAMTFGGITLLSSVTCLWRIYLFRGKMRPTLYNIEELRTRLVKDGADLSTPEVSEWLGEEVLAELAPLCFAAGGRKPDLTRLNPSRRSRSRRLLACPRASPPALGMVADRSETDGFAAVPTAMRPFRRVCGRSDGYAAVPTAMRPFQRHFSPILALRPVASTGSAPGCPRNDQ